MAVRQGAEAREENQTAELYWELRRGPVDKRRRGGVDDAQGKVTLIREDAEARPGERG